MRQFENVIVTSDILATSQKEQDSNLRWLRDLFTGPIQRGAGLPVEIGSRQWNDTWSFDRKAFFELSGLGVDLEETQIYFSPKSISVASIEYLKSCLHDGTIVVGYEISASTREILTRAGVTYVDMWLHPIRFMDDLLFAFQSNDPSLDERIQSFELPEELSFAYASRLRVQMYRGKPRLNNDLKTRSALFVGQTLKDKAIASDSGMLTLLDYRAQFERTAKSYNHVYYSRHPFVKSGDEKSLSFTRGFRNVSLTSHPVYMMLATDELEYVFSISSSVVTEAKYFGKKVDYLYQPPVKVYTEGGYSSVLHNFLFSDFWRFVFLGGAKPDSRAINFVDGRNKMRDMLSWYWGFRTIDRLEGLYNTVSNLVPTKG
ncbi:hypothetical protein [Oryzibacter oryziterrae]|uniref:hypothetical protein n=1 Tax=Oryzibacter oryziterrae TaxID=2766474 RepID=UPI001F25BD61|nr:hypothetical protein [Oryzibacter oryziterrae]